MKDAPRILPEALAVLCDQILLTGFGLLRYEVASRLSRSRRNSAGKRFFPSIRVTSLA